MMTAVATLKQQHCPVLAYVTTACNEVFKDHLGSVRQQGAPPAPRSERTHRCEGQNTGPERNDWSVS